MKMLLGKKHSVEDVIQYKKYRNELNKLLRITKINYYKQKLDETKNDYKKTWKLINDVTNKRKNIQKHYKIKHNGSFITDEKIISDIFNNFFINAGLRVQAQINEERSCPGNRVNKHNNSIFLFPVNHNELIEHIKNLKNNSAPGMD